ncbi:hypothetical protein BH24ACT5_BH24ACT5_04800 [soil metagenome]
MAGELSKAGADIERIFSVASLRRASQAAADVGKTSAEDVADQAIGGGTFSGMPGRRLATVETVRDDGARIDFVPAGLWMLAEQGRRRAVAKVTPRSAAAAALRTPWGPRASVKGSTSPGKQALTKAYDRITDAVPEAVGDEFDVIISESGF